MIESRPARRLTALSNTTPLALGSEGAGASDSASRGDHRHPMPSASDVGAAASNHTHAVTSLTGTANSIVGLNGSGVGAARPVSADVLSVIDAANNAAILAILGLGDLATQDTINPATQLVAAVPVSMGGTGATTASDARTNIGLGNLATLDQGTGLVESGGNLNVDTNTIATRAYVDDSVGTRRIALLAGCVSTTTSVGYDGVGDGYIDPAEYAISGRTLAITLEAIGQVVAGVTSTLVLYDLTASASAATLSWTESSATRKTASVTAPGGAHVYELRFSKSGGGANDYALVGGVNLIFIWS